MRYNERRRLALESGLNPQTVALKEVSDLTVNERAILNRTAQRYLK
jgi:hypothetical protein